MEQIDILIREDEENNKDRQDEIQEETTSLEEKLEALSENNQTD